MKSPLLVPLILVSSVLAASAQISFNLQFSDFGDNNLTGIADETGDVASGLSWGLLVAETGNDFSNPITTQIGISTADGAELAPGFRFYSGGTTIEFDPFRGVIAASNSITLNSPGFGTGDSFALIWFQRGFTSGDTLNVGDNYGLLTRDEFLIPSAGATEDFSFLFGDTDPIRSADLTVQAVPEPSSILLISLASTFLLRRRR